MNRHFYLVFNPFLDSSEEDFTQAHRFYYELRKRKKKDTNAKMYWGKISKSKKDDLNIKMFKEIILQNKDTYLFISDYKHLWVAKVENISADRPDEKDYDSIYKENDVEVWFEISDFILLENSQKSTAERISFFKCYGHNGQLISDNLTSYLSGLRFPLILEDSKTEAYFTDVQPEILKDSPLIQNNVSARVIHSITSYCIPEKVFKELPHSAKEEIIKAEIELLDNKIYNLNSITFSYLKALECVINDIFKKSIMKSQSYNKIWFNKKRNSITTFKNHDSDISIADVKTNFSLVSIFRFLKDGHRNNCQITTQAFEQSPKLQWFLGKELNDISYNMDLINLRNALAHDSDFIVDQQTFESIRSTILGHAQAGLINKAYKSYNRSLYEAIYPSNNKRAA